MVTLNGTGDLATILDSGQARPWTLKRCGIALKTFHRPMMAIPDLHPGLRGEAYMPRSRVTSSPQMMQTLLAAFIETDGAGRTVSYLTANAFCSGLLRRCEPLGYPNPGREGKLPNFRKHAKCILMFNLHPEQSARLGPGDMECICRALASRDNRLAAAASALQGG
jgi:hypothetical protein